MESGLQGEGNPVTVKRGPGASWYKIPMSTNKVIDISNFRPLPVVFFLIVWTFDNFTLLGWDRICDYTLINIIWCL